MRRGWVARVGEVTRQWILRSCHSPEALPYCQILSACNWIASGTICRNNKDGSTMVVEKWYDSKFSLGTTVEFGSGL